MGAAVEFIPRGRFKPVTDMLGGGKFRLPPGAWTDDTSMALCLADSLLAKRGFDATDQMQRYVRWIDCGYNSSRPRAFGIGKTVLAAMMRFYRDGNPYAGSTDLRASGNGSLMRLAPIPIYFHRDPASAIHFAAEMSRTTHGSPVCVAACQYLTAVLLRAFGGEQDKSALFDDIAVVLPDELGSIANFDYRHKSADEISGSGYVVESLEAALWAFWHADSFEAAVLAATNLGDDADTTAAITGQLAGAYFGAAAIPTGWLTRLYRGEDIRQTARGLALQIHHGD